MKIDEMVESYIALRDKKSALKNAFDAKIAGIDEMMRKLEALLLAHFNETGVDCVNTSVGSAFRDTKVQVSSADWETFLGFVRAHNAWDMLVRQPAKSAVLEWEEENATLPPGLNKRTEITVKIRRK